jgi:hypothetical protein
MLGAGEHKTKLMQPIDSAASDGGGKLIVITAPLSEAIDHAGYFIQVVLASLPIWVAQLHPQGGSITISRQGTDPLSAAHF